ncbi:hypothetical protein E2C01_085494 [Portunus trituberculatus]|uniref:Uncharacterized protein n=1 Tax=Portunus trituberculatus TaxID=210409 RepID=A0A5B7J6Z6_PORTR|nr:hypothetical protein [Portunus trituberculatus]
MSLRPSVSTPYRCLTKRLRVWRRLILAFLQVLIREQTREMARDTNYSPTGCSCCNPRLLLPIPSLPPLLFSSPLLPLSTFIILYM